MNANRPAGRADHVSVSQINLYLMCPLKYRFAYIDRLPRPFRPIELALGTAFHAAIEWWHKSRDGGSSPTAEDVARILRADLEAQAFEPIRFGSGETLDDAARLGSKLVSTYVNGYNGKPVHGTEVPFRVPLIDLETGEQLQIPLDGYFDLIEHDDTVVELKTAKRAYDMATILHHLQLTAYAYAYRVLYGRPANLRLEVITKTKRPQLQVVEVERCEAEMVQFFHIAKSVSGAVRNGHFHPKHGWQCSNCEYRKPCQQWRG